MITVREDIAKLYEMVGQGSGEQQEQSPIISFDGEKYIFAGKVFVFMDASTQFGDGTYMPILVDPESLETIMQNPLLTNAVLNFNESEETPAEEETIPEAT